MVRMHFISATYLLGMIYDIHTLYIYVTIYEKMAQLMDISELPFLVAFDSIFFIFSPYFMRKRCCATVCGSGADHESPFQERAILKCYIHNFCIRLHNFPRKIKRLSRLSTLLFCLGWLFDQVLKLAIVFVLRKFER